jgi:superfamily II DNA helicase RecQ
MLASVEESSSVNTLYVTLKLCQTENFGHNLLTIHGQGVLNRIAIDEAHCIIRIYFHPIQFPSAFPR